MPWAQTAQALGIRALLYLTSRAPRPLQRDPTQAAPSLRRSTPRLYSQQRQVAAAAAHADDGASRRAMIAAVPVIAVVMAAACAPGDARAATQNVSDSGIKFTDTVEGTGPSPVKGARIKWV